MKRRTKNPNWSTTSGAPEDEGGTGLHRLLLQQVVTMFNTGDTLGAWHVFSPEYVDHQKPAFIDTDGPEEFAAIVVLARRSLPNLQVSIEDVVVEGDKLAARLRWHSTDAQGRTIDRETNEILRFSNGQVAEHWDSEAWSVATTAMAPGSGRGTNLLKE